MTTYKDIKDKVVSLNFYPDMKNRAVVEFLDNDDKSLGFVEVKIDTDDCVEPLDDTVVSPTNPCSAS